MPVSERKDSELTQYQLHCRYCRLHKMTLQEAAKLWNDKFNQSAMN